MTATATLSGGAAIAGIGATEFSKASGRSELQLAVEACHDALDDAGLEPADVDGMVTFTMDSNAEIEVARGLGVPALTHFSRVHYGGGAACATVQQAVLAVVAGAARRRRLLPGVQRAIGPPLRPGPSRPQPPAGRPTPPPAKPCCARGTRRSGW